jgi:hypothetical protein
MTRAGAAAAAISDHLVLYTLPANYTAPSGYHRAAADANAGALATEALTASDAVLFSDEAVERAAQALRRHMGGYPDENWTEEVQIVINALKGTP